VLYACGEVSLEERDAVERHVAACPECAAEFASELRLQQMLTTLPQPADGLDASGALLEQCRSELAEALDEGSELAPDRARRTSVGVVGRWFAWCRMELSLHPALGAALFVLIGMGMGRAIPASATGGAMSAGIAGAPTMVVSGTPKVSDQDLQNLTVSGIYSIPGSASGQQKFEVDLRAMKPIILDETQDGGDVKRVLIFVLQNGQRYSPDLLLDSVDALRSQSEDADVRHVLCMASRHNANPGVRLRALESLRGYEQDAAVKDAMLDALLHDPNPGVRNEAMSGIAALAQTGAARGDAGLAEALSNVSEHDTNHYIRLQAAVAIRYLQAGSLH